jgi:HAD superfamily hydrolase (TIGR01549 family)
MTIKSIIWDLDGTLIHFKIDYIRARKAAIEILSKYDVPKDLIPLQNSILDNVKTSRRYLTSKNVPEDVIDKLVFEINSRVSEIEYEAALQATKVKHIEKVLEFASKKGLKQVIYTYNTHQNAKKSLEKTEILSFFDMIVGRDDVKNPKPHKDHINVICEKLKVNPGQCVVIGDTYRDIEGALKVGAYSIAVETKLPQVFKDKFEDADFLINQSDIPHSLIKILNELIIDSSNEK